MLPERFDTGRLVLRPIAQADAGAIFEAYAQDPEVAHFLIWRPHRSRDETCAYVASCLAVPPHIERTYVMTGRADGDVCGAFALRRRAPHRLDCGYVLARPWWRQGLMAETLTAIGDWAMQQPWVFRLGAVCDVDNIASAGVLEKAGFAREGVLRQWLVHPNISDQPRDCFSYARVR